MRATEIVKKKYLPSIFQRCEKEKQNRKFASWNLQERKIYVRQITQDLYFHLHPYQLFLYWLVNLYVLVFFKNQNVILDFILTAILQKRIGRPPLVIKEFIEEYDVDALLPDNAELLLKFIPTETEVRGYRFTKAGQGRIHNHGISLS